MPPDLLILTIAVGFTIVTGINDGGALISPGLRVPALSVLTSLAILTAAIVAAPLLISTAVAETLARELVPAGPSATTALLIGIVAAVAVVMVLAWLSLPTSLTLAIIGGISGAGIGLGAAVGWDVVLRVLAIGLAAPVAGAVLAMAAAWMWHAPRAAAYLATVRRAHTAAFVAQSIAYGANDGQKMLVLFIVAGVASGGGGGVAWWAFPVIAVGFGVGAVLGLPRIARSMGTGIVSARSTHVVTAEFSAAAAVLGSAAAGAPVSMTQAIAGGLLGAGVHDSYRRVRWRVVRNLGLAWIVTLPVCFGIAAGIGLVVRATVPAA